MERQVVESKLLQGIAYDPEKKILEVQFHPNKKNPVGSVFRYEDVLPEEAKALFEAKSKGGHFLKYIKPNRTCSRVENADEQIARNEEQSGVPNVVRDVDPLS